MTAALEIKQTSTGGAKLVGRDRQYGSPADDLITVEPQSDGTFLVTPACSIVGNIQKRTVTVGHADLTDADGSQTISIGAPLPANARIVGVDLHTYTPFTGGTLSAMVVDIGTADDVDAIVDGANILAAAVDGAPSTQPAGIRPNKRFATGGAQLTATFLATGDTLLNATAGAVTIDVLFTVLE